MMRVRVKVGAHCYTMGLDVRFLCPNMDCPVKVEGPETFSFISQAVTALDKP